MIPDEETALGDGSGVAELPYDAVLPLTKCRLRGEVACDDRPPLGSMLLEMPRKPLARRAILHEHGKAELRALAERLLAHELQAVECGTRPHDARRIATASGVQVLESPQLNEA